MKTAKIKMINVVNNTDYIKKIDVYTKVNNAMICLMDKFKYFGLIKRIDDDAVSALYSIYNVLFKKDDVIRTYTPANPDISRENDIWDINIDLVVEFAETNVDTLLEKLISKVERLKAAIENHDNEMISNIEITSDTDEEIPDLCDKLSYACESYEAYRTYKTHNKHNKFTIYGEICLIKYILDTIVFGCCNDIYTIKEASEDLYKCACAYFDLLYNLLYELEVEFYVGDDEEKKD